MILSLYASQHLDGTYHVTVSAWTVAGGSAFLLDRVGLPTTTARSTSVEVLRAAYAAIGAELASRSPDH